MSSGNMAMTAGAPPDDGSMTGGDPNQSQSMYLNRGAPPDDRDVEEQPPPRNYVNQGGHSFRTRQKGVAVRRTIRVVVREEQLQFVTPSTDPRKPDVIGATIPLKRDTIQSIDNLVKAVRDQVDSWGIAGNGLYWRPVLELQVAPDGQRRADDLARLLKNSDLELAPPVTASNQPQGPPHGTR